MMPNKGEHVGDGEGESDGLELGTGFGADFGDKDCLGEGVVEDRGGTITVRFVITGFPPSLRT